jgi:putative nucleotidyltransferase with HDIG domain
MRKAPATSSALLSDRSGDPGPVDGTTWRARPLLAVLLHVAAHGIPVAVSVAVVFAVSSVVAPPHGSRALYVCWWVALSAAATVALITAGKLSRRLLPLATLMRLSLVFPDGAPSRFRVARRSGTVATLEERLADARAADRDRTTFEAAQLLLQLVAHLDDHDRLTRGHSERVRAYAQSIGRELGLGRPELDLLNWAALLHDVGKLEVPHEVLTKQGRPTPKEWELLRRHPEAGAELAAPLRDWLGEWGDAIEEHHERWDGTGYPHGLAATDISLAGRIVAVADVYDVITSSRSYKRAGSAAAARRELARCAGTQFDPTIVRAFLAMSVRSRRVVTGPLSWLAHAPVLARVPLAPAAGVVSAAVVATGVAASPAPAPAGRGAAEQAVPTAAPALRVPAPAADGSAPAAPQTRRRRSAIPTGQGIVPQLRPDVSTPRRGSSPGLPSDAPPPSEPSAVSEGPHATPRQPAADPDPKPAPAPARVASTEPPAPPLPRTVPPDLAVPPVVQPVVEDVVGPVVEDVVKPVIHDVVQPVVQDVVTPVVEGVVVPATETVLPAETVPPLGEAVSGLPVVGQLLPPGSSKTKPTPLLQLP